MHLTENLDHPVQIDSKTKEKNIEAMKASHIPNPILVILVDSPGTKQIEMCRAALGNWFVFKKYVDCAMDFPQEHFTWKHWTSVRSSLMQDKYIASGVLCGVHRGSRLLVFPNTKLPNIAVAESECYRIMC